MGHVERGCNKKLAVGDGMYKCELCDKVLPESKLNSAAQCRDCAARRGRKTQKEALRAQQRAVQKATHKLATALSKAKDTAAVTPSILESFFENVGGPQSFGKKLAEDFMMSRGEGLTPEQLEGWSYNAQTMARWYDIIMKIQGKEDERNTTDISSISEEDLEATVKQVAGEMLLNDPDIRVAVLKVAAKKDPAVLAELADELNALTFPKEPVIDSQLEYESPEDFE